MLQTIPPYVTEAEFLAWPDTDERMELLDGEVIVTPPPIWHHQRLVGSLYLRLHAWAASHPGRYTVGLAPCALRFGKDRILEPDLFVIGRPLGDDTPPPIRDIPALCVEVLSPSNREYDRRTKRLVYGQAGVPEFWVVDPAGLIEVFHGPDLVARIAASDTLSSPTLPGLTLDVTALMRG